MPAFRSRIFGYLVHYAHERGVDLTAHFGDRLATGAEAPLVDAGDLQRLGELLVARSGTQWFSIEAARAAPRGLYAVTEYVGRSSGSLREAIEQLVAFGALINPHMVFELDPGTCVFAQRLPGEPSCLGRVANEFTLLHQRQFAAEVTGRSIAPKRVLFAHPRPDLDLAPLRAALGTSAIDFDQGRNGLQFARDDLHAPLLSADPTLATILERDARQQLPPADELGEVRACMTLLLERGSAPSASEVARLLHASERTLQRRLSAHGTSFRILLDEIRAAFAVHLLRDRKTGAAAIAEQLGYADVASFSRAFRRWHGVSVSTFRARR